MRPSAILLSILCLPLRLDVLPNCAWRHPSDFNFAGWILFMLSFCKDTWQEILYLKNLATTAAEVHDQGLMRCPSSFNARTRPHGLFKAGH